MDVRPELIVRGGETKTILPRTHQLSRLVIEPTGTLNVVQRSISWLILHVEGDANIAGTLRYQGMRYGNETIEATAPDGAALSHQFSVMTGGYGGRGGSLASNAGGAGARGGPGYGGGGGGGGGAAVTSAGPGHPARDFVGGDGYFDNRGGDGGNSMGAYINGGLVYLRVMGTLNFNGGVIDLSGLKGPNGSPGVNGNGRTIAGGGGGGGAPGGEGGVFQFLANNVVGLPDFKLEGGQGGDLGPMGRNAFGGGNGQAGPAGPTGYSIDLGK
ncbi:hypothetical protein MB02_01070 [Croceicoccus estronivorus]|uniref:hypothetical protein n=1 Tax=Croceicoccus estronivorus TaxID=1172626 RepID=UPI000835667C|nr:hypothetical protein [Croceicoccus estronivorus]OCC25295.1 hypothetical protein MB02_01070 [Croceicoccus estronivorus]